MWNISHRRGASGHMVASIAQSISFPSLSLSPLPPPSPSSQTTMAASISPPAPPATTSQPRRSRLLDALDGNLDAPSEDVNPSPAPPSLSQLGIGKRKREPSANGSVAPGPSQKRVASGSSVHEPGAEHSKEELNRLPSGLLAYTQSTGAYSFFPQNILVCF